MVEALKRQVIAAAHGAHGEGEDMMTLQLKEMLDLE